MPGTTERTKVWVVARQLQMGTELHVSLSRWIGRVPHPQCRQARHTTCVPHRKPFFCVAVAWGPPRRSQSSDTSFLVAIFSFSLDPPATRLTKPQHCRLPYVSARAATVHVELASRGATASTPHRRARCMSPSWHHDHDDGGSDATYIHACRVPVWPARLPRPNAVGSGRHTTHHHHHDVLPRVAGGRPDVS